MKAKHILLQTLLVVICLSLPGTANSQTDSPQNQLQSISTNSEAEGLPVKITFKKGIKHYFPLMAVWVEDTTGAYIHPLYVAESIAKGKFRHARFKDGEWQPGEKIIPAALPYWGHRQTDVPHDSIFMPTPEHPLPDAYTGATPSNSFILNTVVEASAGKVFNILFEINQSWDWNDYWYNGRYPGNQEYLKSAQPALVYKVTIHLADNQSKYTMKPVGHSHPYGASGKLYEDISTLTTARKIAESIIVEIK
jgi:hypothetical protein